MYYDDLKFAISVHRFFSTDPSDFFVTESNSLEFIRSGHIQLKRKSDGQIIDLAAPAFYWLHQDASYRYIVSGLNPGHKYTEHIYVDIRGERSFRMVKALDELFPEGMFHPQDPEEVSRVFFHLLQLYRSDPKKNLPEMGALTERLMYLAYASAEKIPAESEDPYHLDKIAEQIRSDPFAKYDFHRIARQLEISDDHFRRIFQKKHQLTPHAYLNHQRMLRATELLTTTHMRIKEIVYSCNFRSLIDFSRAFRKFNGMSPRQYRENARRKK